MKHTFVPLSLLAASLLLATGQTRCEEPKPAAEPFRSGDVVGFVGDSITRGGWYHADLHLFYATRFPECALQTFNSGHSGDNATGVRRRLQWDVLDHKPTAVVVMLGMNDVPIGDGLDRAIQNLAAVLDDLKKANVRITLLGPSIYEEAGQSEKKANLGKNAALAEYTKRARELAMRHGAGFVDMHGPMNAANLRMQKADPAFSLVSDDRVHPNEAGHLVMAYTILKAQGLAGDVARIGIDAKTLKTVDLHNCEVTDLQRGDAGVVFTCQEKVLPFVVSEKARPALDAIPFQAEFNRERLTVKNLAPGDYELFIDEKSVGEYAADRLARGLDLATNPKTPQYQQAQRVAQANARRHDIESVQMRGLAFVRHAFLDKAMIDPTDTAAVEKHLKGVIAASPGASFGKTMAERYLGSWRPNRDKNLTLMKSLDETIQKERQPVPHRFRLAPAPESDPRLHADGDGWRLDRATVVDTKRPRVLLIGDSILNGYLKDVSAALKGRAYIDAWVTPANQADKSLPKKLGEILANGPYDVIHFNLGLHGYQKGRIPEGQYEALSRALVKALRERAPKASLIWASTTPITVKDQPTELDLENNPVIAEHNRLAAKVMKEEGVSVNDLYTLMLPKLALARGDKFHWKPEGREVQAQAVSEALLKALDGRKPATK